MQALQIMEVVKRNYPGKLLSLSKHKEVSQENQKINTTTRYSLSVTLEVISFH